MCILLVALYMCAMSGPVCVWYVCYGWPCMCALGCPVYVNYGWSCICMLWVDLYIDAMGGLYMYAMGGPVYVWYAWPCICILWLANLPVSTIFILYFENLLMLGFCLL